jgi:hypothetical protein
MPCSGIVSQHVHMRESSWVDTAQGKREREKGLIR